MSGMPTDGKNYAVERYHAKLKMRSHRAAAVQCWPSCLGRASLEEDMEDISMQHLPAWPDSTLAAC